MDKKKTSRRVSPEARELAVRLLRAHEERYGSRWAATGSIEGKIGCSPATLRNWARQAARGAGDRSGPNT